MKEMPELQQSSGTHVVRLFLHLPPKTQPVTFASRTDDLKFAITLRES